MANKLESSARSALEGLAMSLIAHAQLNCLRVSASGDAGQPREGLAQRLFEHIDRLEGGAIGMVFAGSVGVDAFEIQAQFFDRITGDLLGSPVVDRVHFSGSTDPAPRPAAPHEQLEVVLANLEAGVTVPADFGARIARGVRAMNERGKSSLWSSIGATRRGRSGSLEGQAKQHKRNELIRRAYAAVADEVVTDPSERLGRLVDAVGHVNKKLRGWRMFGGPEADPVTGAAPQCYVLLLQAANVYGGDLPRSRRALQQIVWR